MATISGGDSVVGGDSGGGGKRSSRAMLGEDVWEPDCMAAGGDATSSIGGGAEAASRAAASRSTSGSISWRRRIIAIISSVDKSRALGGASKGIRVSTGSGSVETVSVQRMGGSGSGASKVERSNTDALDSELWSDNIVTCVSDTARMDSSVGGEPPVDASVSIGLLGRWTRGKDRATRPKSRATPPPNSKAGSRCVVTGRRGVVRATGV